MTPRTSFLSGRFVLRVAALLGVLALYAPSPARAGCGDYVVLGSGSQAHEVQTTHPMKPAPGNELPTLPAAPPKPCNGPTCSGHVPNLPILPVAPVTAPAQDWAFAVAALQDDHSSSGSRTLEPGPMGSPIHHPRSIYHPPRFQ